VKVRAILNPRAGVAGHGTREAVERGRPSWKDYAVYLTREPGHATELAREAVAGGADLVLAVGGDGTVNEVARGVLGSAAALGVVPAGSGNGLARALGIPLRPGPALGALESGVRRRMDVGLLNGRPFLNVAGAGFDAVVGHAFHERGKRGGRRGILGYVCLSVLALRAYRAPRLAIEAGGESLDLTVFVVTFANGPQYGSGAVINPGGKLDDGRLEVIVLEDGPLWRTLLAAPRLFAGGLDRVRGYRRLVGAAASVTAAAPVVIHCDGDAVDAVDRIEVGLLPRALQIVVPAAAVADPAGPFSACEQDTPRARSAPQRGAGGWLLGRGMSIVSME
jgi:diacylglycerol kinase (ATP)